MDRVLLSVSSFKEDDLLKLFNSDIPSDLAGVFFFFRSPRAPLTTGSVVVFMSHVLSILISRSLYLDSFPVVFKEAFLSAGTDMSLSRHVLLLVFYCYIWSVCVDVSVSLNRHVSEYSDYFVFGNCRRLMFVIFSLAL